ncbi:MAG: MEDS domain-containing protein [Frankiaceae bacterium]
MHRRRGATAPADRRRSDHVCLAFGQRAEFLAAAGAFLTEGATAGEQLMYVSDRPVAEMPDDLASDEALRDLHARGSLSVVHLDEIYGAGARLRVYEQLAVYSRAAQDALAAGFSGLRVAAEVTRLALGDRSDEVQVRWEHLADELVASRALSALCGYDQSVVPARTLGDVAAAHPAVLGDADLAPFRLYFADSRLTLAGAVDAFGADRLARLLRGSHVVDAASDGPIAVDVAALEFIDARGAYALLRWGLELVAIERRLMLVGASEMFSRIWHALGFDEVAEVDVVRGAA